MQSLGLDDGKFRMTFHPCRGEESGGATGDTIGCCEELCELLALAWGVAL